MRKKMSLARYLAAKKYYEAAINKNLPSYAIFHRRRRRIRLHQVIDRIILPVCIGTERPNAVLGLFRWHRIVGPHRLPQTITMATRQDTSSEPDRSEHDTATLISQLSWLLLGSPSEFSERMGVMDDITSLLQLQEELAQEQKLEAIGRHRRGHA